jgi:hypothetical protein
MKVDKTTDEFKENAAPSSAADLFMPQLVEVVRFMAQIAAENDYKHFLTTGKIAYSEPHSKEVRDE